MVTWNEDTPTDEGRHGFGSGVAAAVMPSTANHRSIIIMCVPTTVTIVNFTNHCEWI